MPSASVHEFDFDLAPRDIQSLSSADGVAAFFSRLGYNTNSRLEQSPENLGITAETTCRPIRRIERIADQEGLFQVYLFELTSVTVAETRALARSFRNLSGNFLLVLTTSDFERLDFVLLERHVPSGAAKATIGTRQAGIRPRVLTVDRRNAGRVQLRVLRRLTWTEPDPFAQFDKIQSAYAVADWSEEHFNNRALFADYFLLERLREFEEWREDPKPGFRALRELYRGASARLAGEKESVLRQQLLEPVLEVLGFTFTPGKEAGSEAAQPDYRLFSSESGTTRLAICLAYPWDRFLDGKDYTRDAESPEENPGALVVSLLESGEAPWAIVTNGRLWRLYSQKTFAKATNYYEIDLEEVLAQMGPHAPDPSEAFRYFWLPFRRAAFVEEEETVDGAEVSRSFLDRLLQGSEDYAKELGARLKDRVFIEVFPHLAAGFISDIRSSRPATDSLTESELGAVFQGTLTLLYRLLFLLYAEARDLFPVKEVRGYYETSLKKMKVEVEKAAGGIEDEVAAKLKRAYRTDSFALYERLQKLCRIVDRGESSLNVPFYNGGLFISDPLLENDDPESQAARFLGRYRVPDPQLALAIDLLSRDIDKRRQSLVFIDYKSLGVRQLGSIYEGLLEFKLRTAAEKLGVVKSKGKEVYKPFRELTDRQKAQVERNNKVVREGQVYLENDKRERRATGSYYTPDYIVKYIVEEAVGPVLSKKLEALRPKLREAQKWHLEKLVQAEAKGESPDKYRFGQAVVTRWAQELIDPVFDIKVLDPAMGSGHFLVEAVDFVTDKLIDFLAAFPWNPVLAHLELTRETILAEMDRQKVSVDPSRLTDVNLLKRHVLKRSVYGVDLNPMAVELAKVSLWLHCFTLGAPLSFLDHHLRCGNSLLGTTVEEVDEILKEKGQLTLSATSAWQGLVQAVRGMITVGGLPDVTVEQVAGSRAAYQDAIVGLQPFKRILDVHLARWFVKQERAGSGGRTRLDPFTGVLRNPELLNWASGKPSPTLDAGPTQILLQEVDVAARQRRFFHWELEFPEAFFDLRRTTGNVRSGESEAGFDAIIGNPPYINVKRGIEKGLKTFSEATFSLAVGQWDEGELFYELALGSDRRTSLVNDRSLVGLIVPKPFFLSESYELLRRLLIGYGDLQCAPCGECFEDSGVEATIGIVGPRRDSGAGEIRMTDGRKGAAFPLISRVPARAVLKMPFHIFSYMLPGPAYKELYLNPPSGLTQLSRVISWTRGIEMGKRDPSISAQPFENSQAVIVGENMEAFQANATAWVRVDPADPQKFKPESLYLQAPKLLLRRVASTLIAAVDETGAYTLNTIYVARVADTADSYAVCALLNSRLTRGIFKASFNLDDTLFPYIRISQLDRLLIPSAAVGDEELSQLGHLAERERGQDLCRAIDARVGELYGLTKAVIGSLLSIGDS